MAAGFPAGGAGVPPIVPAVTGGLTPNSSSDLLKSLTRRPVQASGLVKQAISALETAADMDPRLEGKIGAALKLLRGPAGTSRSSGTP